MAISEITIVKLIIVALILFALLWVLKFTWRNAPIRRTFKVKVDRILPLAEGVIWLSFTLWCIRQLVQNDLWNSIGVLTVVLLVVVALFWLVIRDYMAGIILKSDGSMKLNDWIKIKGIEGKITEMGQRHTFEIEISKNTDLESTIDQIRRAILNTPWASVKKSPEIKLLNDSPEAYLFEISIYSIRLVYFQKIKEYLKSSLGLS